MWYSILRLKANFIWAQLIFSMVLTQRISFSISYSSKNLAPKYFTPLFSISSLNYLNISSSSSLSLKQTFSEFKLGKTRECQKSSTQSRRFDLMTDITPVFPSTVAKSSPVLPSFVLAFKSSLNISALLMSISTVFTLPHQQAR